MEGESRGNGVSRYFRRDVFLTSFFIARQHAVHAWRDIVLAMFSSVCLSVCLMPVLCGMEMIVIFFDIL